MATIHVFVGQCGNQVGTTFLDTAASEAEASVDEGYQMRVSAMDFRPALRALPRRRRHQRSTPTDSATVPSCKPSHTARRIGQEYYYSLSCYAQELSGASIDTSLPQPRCVLVDMEPKVINTTMQCVNEPREQLENSTSASSFLPPQSSSRRFYSLAPQQCVTRGEGSGNNWAFGYHHQGQSRREAIAECLRRESEQQGTVVSTFHVLHSIAGGTGSGVSCLVAEEIKAMFPRSTLLHSVVWPFRCGEVVTQWYNILMAVSTLQDLADGVCIAYNDAIAEELRGARANRGFKDNGEVSFQLMNQRISELLIPLHLPQLLYTVPSPQKDLSKNRILGTSGGACRDFLGSNPPCSVAEGMAPLRYATASDVVEALALDPVMKFFTASLAPQKVTGSTTWASVLGEAARAAQHSFTVPSALSPYSDVASSRSAGKAAAAGLADASAFYMQHRSCLWTIRGVAAHTNGIRELRHLMADSASSPFPMTSLFVSPAEEWRATPSYTRPDHIATLYGPTPMVGESLADAAGRAEELLNVGAFVHHFERYGVSKMELRDAAAVLYDTAAAYHL
ncbi:tubulin_delta_chain [Leishmania braziliensis MHOM/BR/75/M2904]|nr:tubulin_delta_chain [Leishmania braziliensis MHOM/BR/75/M2904]